MTAPSNKVHDKFRERSAGLIDIPTNSKRVFDQFHVSRERLGSHEEYDAEVPNDWGGKGKYVEKPNDIRRNAIGAMGDILAKSSFKQPGMSEEHRFRTVLCAVAAESLFQKPDVQETARRVRPWA